MVSVVFLIVATLFPPLPRSAVINGETWSIVQVRKVRDNATFVGYTDCRTHMIEIKQSEGEREKANILLHEALHAFTCYDGVLHNDLYDNDSDAHEGIYFAANHLTEFMQDNPEVVGYVMAAGRGKK